MGGATLKENNYSDLLPKMPTYCCSVKAFYFNFFSFLKRFHRNSELLAKTAKQEKRGVKCLPKDIAEWRE